MCDISVIIPCYNVEKYLERCLQSVFNQTLPIDKFEVICVDDGSTDDTLNILKKWQLSYPDNMKIISGENRRIGTARNIGLQQSGSDWIAFLDSDDWVEKDYLEKLYNTGVSGNYEIVKCGSLRDKSDDMREYSEEERMADSEKTEYIIDSVEKQKKLFHGQYLKLYAWGKLIKREFLVDNNITFINDCAYEDIGWGNLIHLYVTRAIDIGERLHHYYVNPGSIVLKKDEAYHVDHITASENMWNDWKNRGLFDLYRDELEYEYIYNGYLAFVKILALRFSSPQYSLFKLIQTLVAEKNIDINANKYLCCGEIPPLHKEIINASGYQLTRKNYIEFIELINKVGL